MSIDQSKIYFCNICGYCFVEWGFKPNNISRSICWFFIYGVFKINFEPIFYFLFFFKFKYIKNQWQKPKSGSQILFGLTHHSTKQYPQMLQKYFFDWSVDIFPKSHRLHKIFNKNTVKVSCSCICQKDTKNIIVRLDP